MIPKLEFFIGVGLFSKRPNVESSTGPNDLSLTHMTEVLVSVVIRRSAVDNFTRNENISFNFLVQGFEASSSVDIGADNSVLETFCGTKISEQHLTTVNTSAEFDDNIFSTITAFVAIQDTIEGSVTENSLLIFCELIISINGENTHDTIANELVNGTEFGGHNLLGHFFETF